MKVAVIGALGQLGCDISTLFEENGDSVYKLDLDDVDISNRDSVNSIMKDIVPDLIINTAAFHHVEKCESDPVQAFYVNALGARNLAEYSADKNVFLMHISTDYVFDGKKRKPYVEDDLAKPLNAYGITKLSGELYIQAIAKRYLVIRTSGLYGKHPCRAKGGLNFVQLMLKLANEGKSIRVVDNEVLTPTSTLEVARQLVKLSRNEIYGVCHATAEEYCSWYEFATEIFKLSNLQPNLSIAGPDEFPMKVPRPLYSVLENKLLNDNDLNFFKDWKEGLKEYLLIC